MIASEPKQFASEGTRWYRQDGQSVQDTMAKNGNVRAVTLRDARKPENQYIPSVTSVIQIMAKPELDRWKIKENLKVASRTPYLPHDDVGLWSDAVMQKASDEMAKSRNLGTEVHGAIDRWLIAERDKSEVYVSPFWVEDGKVHESHYAFVNAARTALDDLGVSGQPRHVEETFCARFEGAWISGKADLYSECGFIVDWKTSNKPCDGVESVGFDEHVIQMASYSVALFGRFADCHNVFLSTSCPGNFQIRTWTPDELARGLAIYLAAYRLWCAKHSYFPAPVPS